MKPVLSPLSIEAYLDMYPALTKSRQDVANQVHPEGVVQPVPLREEAYYRGSDLKQLLAVHGLNDGNRKKHETLTTMAGMCLANPFLSSQAKSFHTDQTSRVPLEMSIGDFDALGWFSNRMDPELKESLSSALKGPALYTNMYLKGPHGPGPAAEVRSKAGSLGHAGSAIHTAADSKGFPELPESAVAQNRICANPTLSLDLRDTDHVAEDTGQLPALREPCKDLEPGPSLQSPMPPSLLPQKVQEGQEQQLQQQDAALQLLYQLLQQQGHGQQQVQPQQHKQKLVLHQLQTKPQQQVIDLSKPEHAHPQHIPSASTGDPGSEALLGKPLPQLDPQHKSWVESEVKLLQEQDVSCSSELLLPIPEDILRRRVAFMLLQDFGHTDKKGSLEIIPKGIHQGRVSQSLGRACLQDVCGVDHQCEAESHDWYYVKLAKQFRSGRIELKLDLHARHRLMRLNDLIEVSPASLADSWILLVPSEIDEEQSKREQLGVPKPAQFSSAQQLVTRGLGHSCQGIAGRRGFKRKGNGW